MHIPKSTSVGLKDYYHGGIVNECIKDPWGCARKANVISKAQKYPNESSLL